MDVLGTKGLVLLLPKMVTSSVCNTRAKTGVLGMDGLTTPKRTKEGIGDKSAGSF